MTTKPDGKDSPGPKAAPLKPKNHRDRIHPGSVVNSAQGDYEICQLLGSGGFGDVYMVRNMKDDTIAAMKVEPHNVPEGRERLALEVLILTSVTQLDEWRRVHFVKLLCYGQTEEFKFLVMTLVGKTISDFQRQQKDATFPAEKAVQISIQCLEAVSQVHYMGFIHRDIKPNNFALGMGTQKGSIILLDFGIARRMVHKELTGVIRKPRHVVKFIGSLRYASRNSMRLREQSWKDDLESLFYTILEVFNIRAIFWWQEKELQVVLTLKQTLFNDELTILRKFPPELSLWTRYIDKLGYYSIPDYFYLRRLLKNIAYARGLWRPHSPEAKTNKYSEMGKIGKGGGEKKKKSKSKKESKKDSKKSKKSDGKKESKKEKKKSDSKNEIKKTKEKSEKNIEKKESKVSKKNDGKQEPKNKEKETKTSDPKKGSKESTKNKDKEDKTSTTGDSDPKDTGKKKSGGKDEKKEGPKTDEKKETMEGTIDV